MLSSLRVRLPLLFFAGIVLSSLVTAAIAVRLFQDFAHDQTVTELRREAKGISRLYANAVRATYSNNPRQRSDLRGARTSSARPATTSAAGASSSRA